MMASKEISLLSNSSKESADSHGFLIMGTGNLFLCHLPMFFMPNHSYQVILEAQLAKTDMDTYLRTRNENPGKPLIITNSKPMLVKDIVNSSSFSAVGSFADVDGNPVDDFIKSTTVTVKKSLLFEHLNPNLEYSENLTYYIYGTNSEFHLSHLLSKYPNFQQELDVILSEEIQNKIKELNGIPKISIPSLAERSKQPIKADPLTQSEYTIRMDDGSTGTIKIGTKYWINNTSLNQPMNM